MIHDAFAEALPLSHREVHRRTLGRLQIRQNQLVRASHRVLVDTKLLKDQPENVNRQRLCSARLMLRHTLALLAIAQRGVVHIIITHRGLIGGRRLIHHRRRRGYHAGRFHRRRRGRGHGAMQMILNHRHTDTYTRMAPPTGSKDHQRAPERRTTPKKGDPQKRETKRESRPAVDAAHRTPRFPDETEFIESSDTANGYTHKQQAKKHKGQRMKHQAPRNTHKHTLCVGMCRIRIGRSAAAVGQERAPWARICGFGSLWAKVRGRSSENC